MPVPKVKMKLAKYPTPRRCARSTGPRVKVFADGSAVILDEHGGSIGWIEASPKYTTRPNRKRRRQFPG